LLGYLKIYLRAANSSSVVDLVNKEDIYLISWPYSLELISQNQPVIQQCFFLTINQHQQQLQKPSAEQGHSP
jgi:hypothetical protein